MNLPAGSLFISFICKFEARSVYFIVKLFVISIILYVQLCAELINESNGRIRIMQGLKNVQQIKTILVSKVAIGLLSTNYLRCVLGCVLSSIWPGKLDTCWLLLHHYLVQLHFIYFLFFCC